jgi:hypothetical protein
LNLAGRLRSKAYFIAPKPWNRARNREDLSDFGNLLSIIERKAPPSTAD